MTDLLDISAPDLLNFHVCNKQMLQKKSMPVVEFKPAKSTDALTTGPKDWFPEIVVRGCTY